MDPFAISKFKVVDADKLINKIKVNKDPCEDKIPKRQLNMAGRILIKPFADVISPALSINTFPDKAKRAFVTAGINGSNNKHVYNNRKLARVLKVFPKAIEFSIFYSTYEIIFSIIVSVHWKLYGT